MTKIPFAIAIAAAALSIVPAGAAHLGRFPPAARFYPPPPPALRVYNWTGCYLGAQLGGAFADNKINGDLAGFLFIENDSAAAVVAGGQVGCDLQFARNWVIGAQIDGAWTNLVGSEALTGSQGLPPIGGPPALSGKLTLLGNLNFKANVIATATGRIGYAVNYDSIAGLFYLKGGGAFVDYIRPPLTAKSTRAPLSMPQKGLARVHRWVAPSLSMLHRQIVSAGQLAWGLSGRYSIIGQSSASGII